MRIDQPAFWTYYLGMTAADQTPTLYTIGYGNAAPEAFFARVAEQTIYLALDARLRPWGWHAAYRGQAFLDRLVTDGQVTTARWSERLGNAAKANGGDMRLSDPAAIADLVAVLRLGRGPVLVICGCRDVAACHRRLIATLVLTAAPEVRVIDLETPSPALR